ncbi:mitochondrial Rho GTPase 1-A-like isoform X1 [Acropora millepora]|uniref:mitochondrial Rho GTPase 1-A-like isoform X2 n=1 Tax=Acropora millepora TaxID=45264 RepID=UPI001CF2B370|nr:mitochondrial Rho GTPase 1-A-like isoform X2 [Acropora millepora]XP_044184482.1 mitochondrial Rho GTPase 1-A-like isoform X1 [Acropora millepora]
MKDVRILLVGDPQVGKTSLILSLVSEEFPEEVPTKAEEITIPADVTPEKVPTHIVDYCALEQSEDMLVDEIIKANVVCVVFDVMVEETLERITSYWLPLIRQAAEEDDTAKPVIIVGNKSDLSDGSVIDTILPIMNDFSEVETCVECSARELKNISEMFYYAQKAVLHPTAPLFSADSKELKPLCKAALSRIFKISDVNNDGLLSDKELNDFQNRCFNTPLQGQGLQDVKNVVRKNVPTGLRNNGLTLEGFLFLHKLFIQKGRHETTWTVLRKFGYGDDLKLREEYFCPAIDMGTDQTVELSDAGYQFLIDLFHKHDKDGDEALSEEELEEVFSTCPSMPWGEDVITSVERNTNGWITLQGFLAQWTLTTFLDYTRTLVYLASFGYTHQENEPSLSTAVTVCSPLTFTLVSSVSRLIQLRKKFRLLPPNYSQWGQANTQLVTRSKTVDLQKKQTSRSVFQCYVFGPPGVGKTAFLQAFLGRTLEPGDSERNVPSYAINLLEVNRQEKYLVLREIEWESSGFLLHDRRCDVACFIYDSTNASSFTEVVQLREKLPKTVPCLLVAGKSEGVPAKQDFEMQPSLYCSLNKLPPPQPFSCSGRPDVCKPIYGSLAQMAVHPHLCGPNSEGMTSNWLVAGLAAALVATAGIVIFKFFRKGGSTT